MIFRSYTITGAEIDEPILKEWADTPYFQAIKDLLQARMKDRTEDMINAPASQHEQIKARLDELRDILYQLDSYAPDPS